VSHAEGHVGNPDHLAAGDVDDLLVEQVTRQPQHVLVGVVGRQELVPEENAVERDGADLLVVHRQPGPASPDQIAVHSGGIDQWHQRRVFDATDPAALDVEDLQAHQFRQIEQVSRHRRTTTGALAGRIEIT